MARRTVRRFRTRVILIHWLHTMAFAILAITGSLMFLHLTSFSGGAQIRLAHRIAAAFFVIVPIFYSILDARSSADFLREAVHWSKDDITWLKASVSYYFYDTDKMPPQDRINGDQRLWQLIVIVTSITLTLTGTILWFFKLKIPRLVYQGFLLTHAVAFIIVLAAFLVHFYLRTLHPRFEESLSSMIDGNVSESYVKKHYIVWYNRKDDASVTSQQ
jgi:formate dehydrogenase subunit gamma